MELDICNLRGIIDVKIIILMYYSYWYFKEYRLINCF